MLFLYVPDGVEDDVGDVFVGEPVLHGAGAAVPHHEPGGAQHLQVLGHQWLRYAQGGDQLMHLTAAVSEFPYDAEPDG